MSVPVEPADRVEALDVLRGVALFGVLTVNLVTIFRQSLFEEFLHGPEDAWARAVSFGLEFKAVAGGLNQPDDRRVGVHAGQTACGRLDLIRKLIRALLVGRAPVMGDG